MASTARLIALSSASYSPSGMRGTGCILVVADVPNDAAVRLSGCENQLPPGLAVDLPVSKGQLPMPNPSSLSLSIVSRLKEKFL